MKKTHFYYEIKHIINATYTTNHIKFYKIHLYNYLLLTLSTLKMNTIESK